MGAEDFPVFTMDLGIPSVYWQVGGTRQADFDRETAGSEPVPSYHLPLFKIEPEASVAVSRRGLRRMSRAVRYWRPA